MPVMALLKCQLVPVRVPMCGYA